MADTLSLFLDTETNVDGDAVRIGSPYEPTTITLTNGIVFQKRTTVLPSRVTLIFDGFVKTVPDIDTTAYSLAFLAAVSSVSGNYGWSLENNTEVGSVVKGWSANVPIIFGSGGTALYRSTINNRINSAAFGAGGGAVGDIGRLYFYHESKDDAEVNIFAAS